mmetsp:Transcript_27350/g.63516  ORF Transcript_27350/g.63516 Transcript_27350/m.63516 type:complete len:204 (+) Transcript_27350:37-648(+)
MLCSAALARPDSPVGTPLSVSLLGVRVPDLENRTNRPTFGHVAVALDLPAQEPSGVHVLDITSRLHVRVVFRIHRVDGPVEVGRELVGHVVQPPVPLGRHRSRVVVHVLRDRVVHHPPVAAVLLSAVLEVTVPVDVRAHQLARLHLLALPQLLPSVPPPELLHALHDRGDGVPAARVILAGHEASGDPHQGGLDAPQGCHFVD